MIYEVQAKILFDKEDEARDFYHDCETALPKGTNINPNQENEETSAILLLENNHSQDPIQPCRIISSAHAH
ncbi:hypothetical protein ES708_31411 [subsurface metagenome]